MVNHGDLVVRRQCVQDILARRRVIIVICSLLRQAEAAAGADLLQLGRVGKGIINLVNCIAGDTENPAVLHIDIDVPAEETEICGNVKRLVTGKLARPGGERIACACQIGTLVACQRGGVARQAEADLEIRHGIHQAVEHIALLSLQRSIGNLGAEHGIVDEKACSIARGGGIVAVRDTGINALCERILVNVLCPVCANIARGVLSENDEQHLCKFADCHMVCRAEAPVAANDDILLSAVSNILCSPRRGDIVERGRRVLRLRLGFAQKRHQLGDLFAANGVLRAETAVCIAGDEAEVVEHPHGVVVFDLLLVGEACKVGCCARQHERKRQHGRKQRAKHFFQGGAPFQ